MRGLALVLCCLFSIFAEPLKLSAEKVISELGHHDDINAVVFSPDGRLLASAGDDRLIRIWRPDVQQLERILGGHLNGVEALAFSPDGKLLASGSYDCTVRLWDLGSGLTRAILKEKSSVRAVAISPDGQLLASGGADKTVILWRLDSLQQTRRLEGHTDWLRTLVFHPNGKILASAADDHTIRLWNTETGGLIGTLDQHNESILALAFSPDGRTLASAGSDKTVSIWDPANQQLLRRLAGHSASVNSVAFHPALPRLASGGADKEVRLWTLAPGRPLRRFEASEEAVNSVAFSPGGDLLATGSDDNSVRVWDPDSEELLFTFEGQDDSSVLWTWLPGFMAVVFVAWLVKGVLGSLFGALGQVISFVRQHWGRSDQEKVASPPTPREASVPPPPTRIFISYSHRDIEWLNRLRVHLKPLERQGAPIECWEDTRLRPGDSWREEIQSALSVTDVAILLASADFLASDWIAQNELPPLLTAADNRGATVLVVILKPCRLNRIPALDRFQTVNSLDRPLIDLDEGEQEGVWVQVVEEIEKVHLAKNANRASDSSSGTPLRDHDPKFQVPKTLAEKIKDYDRLCDKLTDMGVFLAAGLGGLTWIASEEFYVGCGSLIAVFCLVMVTMLPLRHILGVRLRAEINELEADKDELARTRTLLRGYPWKDSEFKKQIVELLSDF